MSKKPVQQYVIKPKSAEEMFTDREEPRAAFWDTYNAIQPGEYDIIHYYGIGGIGKTTLLKQIQLEISKKYNDSHEMSVYYNFEKNQSKEDFLFILSRQIMLRNKGTNFPIFDYAFEKWMTYAGKTKAEIDSYVAAKENEILTIEGAIDQIGEIASDFLPFVNVAAAAAKGIIGLCEKESQKLILTNNENKDFYDEIKRFEGDKIEKNLVRYFAHDALKILNKFTNTFVIILDGYEALVSILKDGDERANLADTWLHREGDGLVRQLPNVCWVVAGREQLQWDKELLPDNQKHLMGQISATDAKGYFNQIGIRDDELVKGLYELTNGTPVYMDWCYKKYLQLLEQKGADYWPGLDDFGKNTTDLAERYLRDMSPVHQSTVRLMCCLPDIWDNEMFSWVARKAGYLECLGEQGNKIKELSLIEKMDTYFRVHETFRTVVTNVINEDKQEKLSEIVFQYLVAILDGECAVREKSVIIKSYVRSLERIGKCVKWNDEKLSKLVDCIIALMNKEGDYKVQLDIAENICAYIKKKVHDEENVIYLQGLHCVAMLFNYIGRYKEAKELDEKVYEVRRRVLGEEHPDTLLSLNNLVKFYADLGDYEKEKELGEKVYEARKLILGEEHQNTLISLINLAKSYGDLGDYEKEKELDEKVYETQKRVLGEEHLDTLHSLYNLALTYGILGDYGKSRELSEKVYEARKRILGEEHPDTLVSLLNLASCYEDLGDYERAKELKEKVYEVQKRILGEEHPDTLTSLCQLAISYGNLEDYEKYKELSEKVYEAEKRILGEEHPNTLTFLLARANYYEILGDYEKSRELSEKVYEARKRILGEKHSLTLDSLDSLAQSYDNLEDYEKAVELRKKVYEARKQILGEEQPLTLDSLDSLAISYGCLGDYEKSTELMERVYEARKRILGEEHPKTLECLNSLFTLAIFYSDLGDYEKARELSEKVYEARKQILGENHPDTLDSLDSLAISYGCMGDDEKSVELMEKVYEARKQILGENHPDTLDSLDSLAISYRCLGDDEKSVELMEKVYEARKRIQGENHPDTLDSLDSLAISYGCLGDDEKLEELMKKIYEARKRILGENHPDTLESWNRLSRIYDIVGKIRLD